MHAACYVGCWLSLQAFMAESVANSASAWRSTVFFGILWPNKCMGVCMQCRCGVLVLYKLRQQGPVKAKVI